jgi:hypothetical protein
VNIKSSFFLRFAMISILIAALMSPTSPAYASKAKGCVVKGVFLAGKVKVVNSFADIKVQVVRSFPDVKVKEVRSFPKKCGEWQFVNSFPDFTIQYVRSFPDLKVQFVNSFPGIR